MKVLKGLPLLLLGLSGGFCALAQKPVVETSLSIAHLRGKVKSVIEKYHETENGGNTAIKMDNKNRIINHYNEQGMQTDLQVFNSKDSLAFTVQDEYDSLGIAVKHRNRGKLKGATVYHFDDNGNRTDSTRDQWGTTVIKYNNLGEQTEFISAGGRNHFINFYNKEHDKTEQQRYTVQQKLDQKMLFNYDSRHNLIEKDTYDEAGNQIAKTISIYNAQGDAVEVTEDYQELFSSSNWEHIHKVFSYEYDKQGNWIKCSQLYQGNVINVRERVIEYYQ